ncbi:histidine-phosphotransfer domain, HPT domain-containing protein [Neoconidiobolus thromboides FSU 785]|nr:histidine-phosphotransfer domain, HPT domain-containing protein [Neoconidiobolus thromboides FSU 785]
MSSEENELIDYDVFGQILDMDEEGDNEFSKNIVYNYFEQAETTFVDMLNSLEKKDLPDLSRLGHFLKGSSAALGLKKVKTMCERIQHYGSLKDESGSKSITEQEALTNIEVCIKNAKKEYRAANKYLKDFYEEEEYEEDEEEEEEEEEEEKQKVSSPNLKLDPEADFRRSETEVLNGSNNKDSSQVTEE